MPTPDNKKPDITIFFPVYNDENTVERVTLKSLKVLGDIANNYEVIIINDCSPDRSGDIADELAAKYPGLVKVVHHEVNKGYGAALRSGFAASQYEYICFTDGDDEYDVAELYRFIKLIDYYDLIITFRYKRMYSSVRIFTSRIYNALVRYLFKTRYRDISTGLRVARKSLIADLDLITTSPFIGAEITIKSMLKGYRVGEVGIQTFPRQFGSGASVSSRNIMLTIKDMIRVYRHIFSDDYELPLDRKREKPLVK